MTAPNGAILFNSSTGSDTAASGLGPATAVTGSTGTSTNGSAVVTGIDTTGVSAGDLFWGDTSSGRQFSIIASVDSGTQVTLDDNLGATHSGDLTWAIGGKRAQLWSNAASRRLWINDSKAGWVMEMESGYTDTFSSEIDTSLAGNTTSGRITVRGSEGAATKPVVTFSGTGNATVLRSNSTWYLDNFELLSSNSGATYAINAVSGGHMFRRLRIAASGAGSWTSVDDSSGSNSQFIECEITDCTDVGLRLLDGTTVKNCWIHDNGSHGLIVAGSLGPSIEGCIISGNGGDGINWAFTGASNRSGGVVGNVIYDNTGDGIELSAAPSAGMNALRIERNIFAINGGYGLNCSDAGSTAEALAYYGLLVRNNAYLNNTSGPMNPSDLVTLGAIALTADPFVDAANDDFNINNTAGGGAVLRAATLTMPG